MFINGIVFLAYMRISSSIIHDRDSTKKLAAYRSLIDVQGSVALLLYDVVEALRLPPRQQMAILGVALYVEINDPVS